MAMLLRARACAKINLGLKILARRADGFHDLRTVFQTVALADRVTLEIGRGEGIEIETAGLDSPAGADNLAYRAAELGAPAFGVRGRMRIRIDKRIPLGAGLGGGSSDAAAVLRLLALAARTRARASGARRRAPAGDGASSMHILLRLAAQLGSDVAPFLIGGTVLGLGRGDEVYALPDLGPWHCILALPHASGAVPTISTPAAFAQWDRAHPGPAGGEGLTVPDGSDTIKRFCSLVDQVLPAFQLPSRNRGVRRSQFERRGPKVQAGIENDFQPGVFSLSPDFSRIHQQLRRSQARWTGLSGSGAAQFGLFTKAAEAAAAARALQSRYRCWQTRLVGRREYERGLKIEG